MMMNLPKSCLQVSCCSSFREGQLTSSQMRFGDDAWRDSGHERQCNA